MNSLIFFLQQLRVRARSLGIWVLVWTLVLTLYAAVFNSLSKNAAQTEQLYKSLPKGILNFANISATDYLTKVEKFFSGQFLTIYTLAGSIFALFIGIAVIGGKIEDGTIAGILTKPLKRTQIYLGQFANSLVFIVLGSAAIGTIGYELFNLLTNQKYISVEYFANAFLGTAMILVAMVALGQLLGLFLSKSRAQSLGAFLIVMSWFINSLGSLQGFPQWLRPFSPFYYLNNVQLRDDFTLDWHHLIALPITAVILVIAGILVFRQKDIYL